MATDYSRGRYNVFDALGQPIGIIDNDEFVRSDDTLLYRIDGEEVYEVNGGLVAFLDHGVALSPNGQKLFTIRRE